MKGRPTCNYKPFINFLKARHKKLFPVLWGLASSPLFATTPKIRPDLASIMETHFCMSGTSPDRHDFWAGKVFDSNIEIQTITPKTQIPVALHQLKQASKKLALRQNHGGYGYGICKNGSAWVISAPSPQALVQSQDSMLEIKLTPLKKKCRSIRIDYAPQNLAKTRQLFLWPKTHIYKDLANINSTFLKPGTLALTCLPEDKTRGPELWALIPVHGNSFSFPLRSALGTDLVSLKTWVNQLRIMEDLPPLEDQLAPLDSSGTRLSKHMSVSHNRTLLTQEKKRLQKQQIHLLGENRVKGTDTRDMAWLLWNSPRHRKLLFSPSATHFTLGTQTGGNTNLAVLIFAKVKNH